MQKNDGWKCIRPGKARGPLMGGCITSMMHLRGTDYWPDFNNSIFFWETPEGNVIDKGESLENIDAYLTDLELSGVFSQIKGMLIGRPFGYSPEERMEFEALIKDRLSKYDWPIIMNMDFGHTDPIITIPIGTTAEIDADKLMLNILESAVI